MHIPHSLRFCGVYLAFIRERRTRVDFLGSDSRMMLLFLIVELVETRCR